MEAKAYKSDAKDRGKKLISKLRAKVNPAHAKYMGEVWLASPDGQATLRRIAAYDPGRVTPGKSIMAANVAIRTQLASIKTTGEATKANTDELLQRAQGKIPQKRPDQTAAERKRELDVALASVPAMRAERKQMAALATTLAAILGRLLIFLYIEERASSSSKIKLTLHHNGRDHSAKWRSIQANPKAMPERAVLRF